MATIKTTTIRSVLTNETVLKRAISFLWVLVGASFATYIYVVGGITFSVMERGRLEGEVKNLLSEISEQELRFLSLDRTMTREEAQRSGLSDPSRVSFSTRSDRVALNAER